MKKVIIGIIIGGIVFGISGVTAATLYYSNQVSYEPTDTTWNVNNVKDTLNDLYDVQSKGPKYNVVNLGGVGTYDLTNYEGYENFEINKNIFIVTNTMNMSASVGTRAASGTVNGSGSGSKNLYSATYSNGSLVVTPGNSSISGTVRDSYENVGSVTGSFSITSLSVYLIY